MSSPSDTPHDMCNAYGCPRLNAMSSGDGRWYCSAHFGGNASTNDAITQIMRRDHVLPIVEAVTLIRRFYGKPQWEDGTRLEVSRRLRSIDRTDLLHANSDAGIQGWLMRLEFAIDAFTRDAGQRPLPGTESKPWTVPTVPVSGPTHVSGHLPYAEEHES